MESPRNNAATTEGLHVADLVENKKKKGIRKTIEVVDAARGGNGGGIEREERVRFGVDLRCQI